MEELGAAPPEAMPVSRGRIAVGYARACELANNRDGAANNYKAATQAAPDLLWATIRSEMIQVPFDADLATADAALQKVLESHKDALSPRQVATVHLERAHRALDTYDTKKGIEALTAAVAADATCSDCAYQLGQLYLDLGKSELALKQLEAAQAIAPLDMRVITARVTALLARGDAAGAKTQVDQIPEPYNDFRYARVLKARLQRESGAIADGPAMVDAAVKSKPDFFEGKLELALLKRAQKSADAEKLFRDLVPNVKTAGRYALGPVLQAYAASVSAAKKRAAAVAEAQGPAESDENAQALLILGEALIAAGDKAGAEKLLTEAKQFGDLPKIDTLLTQVAAK
jgi:tetratricopeptide (TPR) repeat protein